MNERDLSAALSAVRAAEQRLAFTLDRMRDEDVAGPSLLPGWTRGHVLAHVALNAHSLVNLFEWARTGVETPQYPSWEDRDADIETHSRRTLAEHRAALERAGELFEAAARGVPSDRWGFEVSGIGGDPTPAATFLFGRLREVEIHHVDLDAGYVPADWDPDFVRRVLAQSPGRLSKGADVSFVAIATDLDDRIEIGRGSPEVEVSGPGGALLAWLLGRSHGAALEVRGGTLPRVPAWG